MVTVFSQVSKYCEENNIPMARHGDMLWIGKIVSTHFRRFWGIKQPAAIIQQAGFVLSTEPGRPMLVIGYPDCFADEMMARITMFYEAKRLQEELLKKQKIEAEMVIEIVTARERKRRLVRRGPEKVFSVKPENPTIQKL